MRTLSIVLWACVASATVVVMNMDELIRRSEKKKAKAETFRVHLKPEDELTVLWVKKPYPVLTIPHY